MSRVLRFVDTGYWLALVNRADRLHVRASDLAANLTGQYVTTEAVLLEVGNSLANQRWRYLAAPLLQRILADPNTEVVPLDSPLLRRAIELYRERPDKEWGLTDCVSFVVMKDRGVQEALAADQHFSQAGFRPLLAPPGN